MGNIKKEEALSEFQIKIRAQEIAFEKAKRDLDRLNYATTEKALLRIIAEQLISINHTLSVAISYERK